MNRGDPTRRARRLLLIAPKAPPYGGMGLQAELLLNLMQEDGVAATLLPSNPPFPSSLRACAALPGLRTLVRCALFCCQLWCSLATVDVVHVLSCSWVYFFAVVSPVALLSCVRRKRVILNYHGGEADQFLRWFGWLAKPVFHLADVVTAPSGFLASIIHSRLGITVEIVPNVVDLAAFRFRERKSLAPRMLVTRHLERLYDVETVLKAFREVQDHYSQASLWIVGSGTQESYLRTLVEKWSLRSVRFFGHVPHAELPAIYDRSDILLNASRADNFPGSLLEAAAAGLVVISTSVGGIPYIFENGESALLVEPGNPTALAAAVVRVLKEPDLAVRLARAARQQCRRYEWDCVRQALNSVYGFEPGQSSGPQSYGPEESTVRRHLGTVTPEADW